MNKKEIDGIRAFLEQKFGVFLSDNISIQGMDEKEKMKWLKRGDRVTYIWTDDFLTGRRSKTPFVLNPALLQLVTDTIKKNDLKIYFGMLSYQGRGDDALYSGFNVFDLLKPYQEDLGLKFFLGYQGKYETTLCKKLREMGVTVFLNDRIQLDDSRGEIVVPCNEPGKAANCVKSIKLIQREVEQLGWDDKKTMVVFVDDDYIMQDAVNFLMLFIPWVLSFASPQMSKEKGLQRLIAQSQKVGFVKNGSPRLQFARRVLREIVYGEKEVMTYRDFLVELLKREIRDLGESFELEERERMVEKLVRELSQVKTAIRELEKVPSDVVVTPENFPSVLYTFGEKTRKTSNLIKNCLQNKVGLGGRVTSLLTTLFLRHSEKPLFHWLSAFTYLLHGDQGAPLSHWLKISFGRGYAVEISLLVQFLLDDRFKDYKVINVIANPHIHQPQQDLNVARMRDTILSSLDLLELLYSEFPSPDFLRRYDIGDTKRQRILRHPDGRIDFDEQLLYLEKHPLIPALEDTVLVEKPLN